MRKYYIVAGAHAPKAVEKGAARKAAAGRRSQGYAMKRIAIVLTKYSNRKAKLLCCLTGFGYTHASISLEPSASKTYSFCRAGFCEETPATHRLRGVKSSVVYRLLVSEAAYEKLKSRIDEFRGHSADYRYTRLGALLCFLHVPFHWKNHYFCSHFVAESLSECGVLRLKKDPSLYLPIGFAQELEQCDALYEIEHNVI